MDTSVSEICVTTRTTIGACYRGIRVCQEFVAAQNGLNGISLWIGTYGNRVDGHVRLTLFDASRADVIRTSELNACRFEDNTWQFFPFEPIPVSEGKVFWFCFESNGLREAPVTLWSNDRTSGICYRNGRPMEEAACFKTHYAEGVAYVLDPLLFRGTDSAPALSPEREALLHWIIRLSIMRKDLGFLRLAHLADAFGRIGEIEEVLSIGCGEGLQEAFLAGRMLGLRIDAVDHRLTTGSRFSLNNLHFAQRDILGWPDEGDYDLVFSVEVLEHIEDWRGAFRNMAAKVAPGKYFYISVPFASRREQEDPALKQHEWEVNEHYLPGFSFQDLESLFAENSLEILHRSNMFRCRLGDLMGLVNKMDSLSLDASLGEIARLFMLDVEDLRARDRTEAVGVRFLGKKRPSPSPGVKLK
jgi:SAM-dependent methyltransferase